MTSTESKLDCIEFSGTDHDLSEKYFMQIYSMTEHQYDILERHYEELFSKPSTKFTIENNKMNYVGPDWRAYTKRGMRHSPINNIMKKDIIVIKELDDPVMFLKNKNPHKYTKYVIDKDRKERDDKMSSMQQEIDELKQLVKQLVKCFY
jgi:hypothetical protein